MPGPYAAPRRRSRVDSRRAAPLLLPVTFAHLRALAALPLHHRNPFDRLPIAQAVSERMPIATGDRSFAAYGVELLW